LADEVGGVGWRESRGGAGDGGENFGFRKAEVDTVGTTEESAEFGNVLGKVVNVANTSAGVVEAREADRAGGGGSPQVVAQMTRKVLSSARTS
jgi:hypothetical protein